VVCMCPCWVRARGVCGGVRGVYMVCGFWGACRDLEIEEHLHTMARDGVAAQSLKLHAPPYIEATLSRTVHHVDPAQDGST